jgi:hypothetical protein
MSQLIKALTGGVPGAAAALGCSRQRTPKLVVAHQMKMQICHALITWTVSN